MPGAPNPLTAHDASIYNTCAGFSGVMTGIGFSLAAFLIGFYIIFTIKKAINLFKPSDLKKGK